MLNEVRSASLRLAVKFDPAPAVAASARVPSIRFTVFPARSCTPIPLPLSVYATAQPCLSPHSPAVAIAP